MSTTTEVKKTEVSRSRNFRNSADIENFYRFVHDNNLRREAHLILETIISRMNIKKRRRRSKKVQ